MAHVTGCRVERGLARIQIKRETIKEKETSGKRRSQNTGAPIVTGNDT